jgi:predicted ester cyclase
LNTDLEAQYRLYIERLNSHVVDDLSDFVHDALTYNGQAMTRRDYQDMLAGDIAAIPDLRFEIDRLVVQHDHVACRINFSCTPEGEFMGLAPNGKSISFSEHVFYRFRDGRICEVLSLIDQTAIRAQLAS